MAPRLPTQPRDSEEAYAVGVTVISYAERLLAPEVLAGLRRAVEHADDAADLEDVELRTNSDSARHRITKSLAAGTMTVDQARDELADARARAEVDTELRDVLERARGQRRAGVWPAVKAIDWAAVRNAGRAAAARVATLAAAVPAGTSIDPTDEAHADLVEAVNQWRGAVDALNELRRYAVVDVAPLDAAEAMDVPRDEWRWGGMLGALAVPTRLSGNAYEAVVQAVRAGAVPACCDPVDIDDRLAHRGKLVDAAEAYFRSGYSALPGVHAPIDEFHSLPSPARELLGRDWPQVVADRAA